MDGTWVEVGGLEIGCPARCILLVYRIASFSLPKMIFHRFASLGPVGLSSTG